MKPKFIGKYYIKNPDMVVKLGFVLDTYKAPHLNKLWEEAERKALEKMPTFNRNDLFHQEEKPDGVITYSFRYYTPEFNRELTKETVQ